MNLIQGDLLEGDSHLIIQQLNCLCVRPHGLSEAIARKYPYADVYRTRTSVGRKNLAIPEHRPSPGMVVISRDPNGKIPLVAGIFGQYDFGKSYHKSYRPQYTQDGIETVETPELRETWFKNGLNILRDWLISEHHNTPEFKIGIPYKIGCGLAGGNWDNYLKMLEDFSNQLKCTVTMYQLIP